MQKLPATSRADLVRAALRQPSGLKEAEAELLGFEPVAVVRFPRVPKIDPPGGGDAPLPLPPVEYHFPSELPRLRFLLPVRTETLASDPPPPPREVEPLTNAELFVDLAAPGPPVPPLVPWARLGTFLRRRLSTALPGTRVDERRLSRQVAAGTPLAQLPCRSRALWAAQAVLLWDASSEMRLFRPDGQRLLRRLTREMGRHALLVRSMTDLPGRAELNGLPAGAPVLALSPMGQLEGWEAKAQAWARFGRRLAARGHALLSLQPVPRDRWQAEVAAVWPAAAWDRSARLPRRGGSRPHPTLPPEERAERVDFLLDLLAPATRLQAPLLRLARLRLGPRADVGTEWDAWHHAEGWSSPDACGFRPGTAYEGRLARRARWQGADAVWGREIGALMRAHHATSSLVLQTEAVLRALLTGGGDPDELAAVKHELARAVERLRLEAGHPGRDESGLSDWQESMVTGRLTEELRQHPEIEKLVARGLSYARIASGTFGAAPWPPGLDAEEAIHALVTVTPAAASPVDTSVRLSGDTVRLESSAEPESRGVFPLASLRSARRWVHRLSETLGHRSLELRESDPDAPALEATPASFALVTDRQRLEFARRARPAWARRMWYDRWGCAVEFRVRDVPFVLRWIPPGRFVMGSPEDDPARYEREGPQHEVTISQGFWLAETPVTQAQWRAVVEEGRAQRLVVGELKPAPSHFEGPETLPVEQVSWRDAQTFSRLLDGLLKMKFRQGHPGFGGSGPARFFGLPTEAQWEYACRAGSTSAPYSGPITLRGENNAPELDAIAWYSGNSGQALEVKNGVDSSNWNEKQYRDALVGTHRVRQKAPNGWGLYDLLGNVWEWCQDGQRDYTAEARTDPPGELDDSSAPRVMRGGFWGDPARGCRVAFRDSIGPGARWSGAGFRLAAGHEPSAAEPPRKGRGTSPFRSSLGAAEEIAGSGGEEEPSP